MGDRLPNGTDYTFVYQRNNHNETVNVIAGCLDYKRQKPVAIGDYYHRDDCTICLCSTTELICNQIHCAPPTDCDGYIKKDPLHCCDVCVPRGVIERQPDEASLNMKLGALTVTLFLIVSLILFTFHRLRRKRLLITLRRLRTLRRQDTSYSCSLNHDGTDNRVTVLNGVDVRPPPDSILRPMAINNGYQIAEAPPSYASAVTLPRPTLSAVSAAMPTVFGEPPPPYLSASSVNETTPTTTTLRRTILASVASALATIRRHRNSNSLPRISSSFRTQGESSQDNLAPSTTATAATAAVRTRPRRDLLWRHSSQTSDYQDYFTDDASDDDGSTSSLSASRESLNSNYSGGSSSSCCCSNCDSGLSRDDDCSLSSNDVRPRSEMSMIRLRSSVPTVDSLLTSDNNNTTVLVQNDVSQPGDVSSSSTDNQRQNGRRLCESCQNALTDEAQQVLLTSSSTCNNNQPNSQNNTVTTNATVDGGGGIKKSKKRGDLCKRKLKKIISRRKKKTNGAASNNPDAQQISSSSRRNRRRRRTDNDVVGDDSRTNDNEIEHNSTSNRQNERMTTV